MNLFIDFGSFLFLVYYFFFFKQKTAYEMRISDWSSDVCSSDLLSNEPGYYKAGAFGIRIENLVVVTPQRIAGAEEDMLGFETITFAPIAQNLVEVALLSGAEADWPDAYHAEVLAQIGRASCRERVCPYV